MSHFERGICKRKILGLHDPGCLESLKSCQLNSRGPPTSNGYFAVFSSKQKLNGRYRRFEFSQFGFHKKRSPPTVSNNFATKAQLNCLQSGILNFYPKNVLGTHKVKSLNQK